MRHVHNDPNKLLLQNALLAQQVAEASKNRQAERARAQAAEDVEKLHTETKEQTVKKAPGNTGEEKGGQKELPRDSRNWSYRPDGSIEENGGQGAGPSSAKRIDIKA